MGGNDGVTQGKASTGDKYQFSFLPFDSNTTTLTSDGTVTATETLTGQSVTVNVHNGQGPSDVASALYNAMEGAGVDAQLNGATISFIDTTLGQEIDQVSLELDATGLESLISIPTRTYTSTHGGSGGIQVDPASASALAANRPVPYLTASLAVPLSTGRGPSDVAIQPSARGEAPTWSTQLISAGCQQETSQLAQVKGDGLGLGDNLNLTTILLV